MLDRGFDILALAVFLLASLPFVTDAGWVDRIVVGTLLVLVVLVAASRRRGVHAAAAARATRPPAPGAAVRARHPRGALGSALGPARSLVTVEPRRVGRLGGRGDASSARAVGIELTVVEAVFVTAALNLGVAIPSSPGFVGTYQWLGVAALGVFGFSSEAGLAFAIVMQAVWYVPTTLVGAVLLVRVARRGWRSARRVAPRRDGRRPPVGQVSD